MKARKGLNFLQPFLSPFFFCKYQIRGQSAAFGNSHLRRGEWKTHKDGMSSSSFFRCHSTARLQKESRGHRCAKRRHASKLLAPDRRLSFERAQPLAPPTPDIPLNSPHARTHSFSWQYRRKGGRGRTRVRSRKSTGGATGEGRVSKRGGGGRAGGSCHVAVIPGRGTV